MFKGSIVALITPMNKKGMVCVNSFKRLINYHVKSGTSAIVVLGTTGESATLTNAERSHVIELMLKFSKGRIPIIVGTGANSTAKGISITQSLENSGVSACLSITPYYNCPTQEGLYRHFRAIAESTNLPQILYNVPLRTGVDLLPITIQRLANIKNIIGIKEATGDLLRITEIKKLVQEDFILLSGDDATALNFMELGGCGVVSVTANIAAYQMANLCDLFQNGRIDKARLLDQKLMNLHQKLFIEPNPIPVKWAAKKLGLIENDTLRLPMTPLTEINYSVVQQALKDADCLLTKGVYTCLT
ncbi:4-hydroxy-tetrahydrodipicolinate synthase [Candidatus Erwinia haradaeae]|uniref:4-hydroxy-tetrahydrodipicolinate synthase n=1 Tax=Candidatus Erwinia haradaeae TaxID=1922217 RepID=A0A451D2X6_9GAMM|nr:4-hydroxy-tetrahydrodipicolinate synthase [Candidatus Erwinia haradaeae]VFP80005.1 4-hydroxy-tetrahydrodipicolinate synthase [Candidatus Erwinia haradaeae]